MPRVSRRTGLLAGGLLAVAALAIFVVGGDRRPAHRLVWDRAGNHASFEHLGLAGSDGASFGGTVDLRSRRAWRRCHGQRCGPVITTHEFGETRLAKGDTIELRAMRPEVTYRVRSPRWRGTVRSTRPPQLIGSPTLGSSVRAVPGAWTGGFSRSRVRGSSRSRVRGFAGDSSWVGVRACPTATGGACVYMADWRTSRGSSVVINPAYAGWYVGAIESRGGPMVSEPAVAYAFPNNGRSVHKAPRPGPLVAVGPLVGPVG